MLERIPPDLIGGGSDPPDLMAKGRKQGGAKNVTAREAQKGWPRGGRQKDRASPEGRAMMKMNLTFESEFVLIIQIFGWKEIRPT